MQIDIRIPGTRNLNVDLSGNFITSIDPSFFSGGTVQTSECVDASSLQWEELCRVYSQSNDDETCSHHLSCRDTELIAFQGNDMMTALKACCDFGGGFPSGLSLVMESASPLRCAPSSSSSSDISIVCECSDETQRYDIRTTSCISSCKDGERWEYVLSDFYNNINSDVGRCVPCMAGTYSVSSVGTWVETCSECSAGEYVSTNRASTCVSCPRGRFSTQNAATECEICTSGHYTGGLEEGSVVCLPCYPGTYSSSNYTVKCELCSTGT